MDEHNEKGLATEEVLEKRRPASKPKRSECLMLFEDAECAGHHWTKMGESNLYLVLAGPVLHRADMKIVDRIGELLDKSEEASRLADAYWRGDLREESCVESLCREGVVVARVGNEAARRAYQQLRATRAAAQPGDETLLDAMFESLGDNDHP